MRSYLRIPSIMRQVRRDRKLNPKELRELQNTKLRAIVKHSYTNVPYYNKLFKDAHLHPNDIQTIDDLPKIPIHNKDDIRYLPSDMVTAQNTDLRTCKVYQTSGTTGIPLTVYWDKKAEFTDSIRKITIELDWGAKLRYRRVNITSWRPPEFSIPQKLGFWKTITISPFDDPQSQLEQMKAFNPQSMRVLPSSALILAKELLERDFQGIRLRLISVGGELIDDTTRNMVRDTFDAPIFHTYGASEVHRIFAECLDHSYHMQSDAILAEVTKNGETLDAGEIGDITVTNFENYAMPALRYNLEDVGYMLEDTCSCGCHYPLMNLTSGRKRDVIMLPSGKTIPAHEVCDFLRLKMATLKQYQVIQEKTDHLMVKIVEGHGFKNSLINEIQQALKERLGDEIEIEVVTVDTIPREKSGKFSIFKTKLAI